MTGGSETLVGVDQLPGDGPVGRARQHRVGQQHRKRLVADEGLCTQYRVAKPVELLLVDVVDVGQRIDRTQFVEQLLFAVGGETRFQVRNRVEMVLNRVFTGAGDDQDLLDSGGGGLFDHVLDHRACPPAGSSPWGPRG